MRSRAKYKGTHILVTPLRKQLMADFGENRKEDRNDGIPYGFIYGARLFIDLKRISSERSVKSDSLQTVWQALYCSIPYLYLLKLTWSSLFVCELLFGVVCYLFSLQLLHFDCGHWHSSNLPLHVLFIHSL